MRSDTIRLYKFCSQKYGLDNLTNRRLKISTLEDLNDPFEFRSMRFPSKRSREIWERGRSKVLADKGIICFCRDWSNPVIWSHCAENHRGLALGFDMPRANTIAVKYRKHRRSFPELSSQNVSTLLKLVESSLSTKFMHWQYEDEVRTFVTTEEKCLVSGLYFKNFDNDMILKEIILGPNSPLTSQEIVETADIGEAKIITSRLAFQSYRVVRQRSAQLQK